MPKLQNELSTKTVEIFEELHFGSEVGHPVLLVRGEIRFTREDATDPWVYDSASAYVGSGIYESPITPLGDLVFGPEIKYEQLSQLEALRIKAAERMAEIIVQEAG
jgi:hypothetical protein